MINFFRKYNKKKELENKFLNKWFYFEEFGFMRAYRIGALSYGIAIKFEYFMDSKIGYNWIPENSLNKLKEVTDYIKLGVLNKKIKCLEYKEFIEESLKQEKELNRIKNIKCE